MRQPAHIYSIPMELCRNTLILRIDGNPGKPYSKLLEPQQPLTISASLQQIPSPSPEAAPTGGALPWLVFAFIAVLLLVPYIGTPGDAPSAHDVPATQSSQTYLSHELARIQARAERQLAVGRLSGPGQNNAYASYLDLTRLGATREARQVLDKLMSSYLERARAHLAQGQSAAAYALYREMSELEMAHQAGEILLEEVADSLLGEVRARIAAGRLYGGDASALWSYRQMEQFTPWLLQTHQAHTELVAELRVKAARQLAAREYTTPERDNAALSYQAILQIIPADAAALAGVQQIILGYVTQARLYLNQSNQAHGLRLLEDALARFPDNPQLQILYRQALAAQAQST